MGALTHEQEWRERARSTIKETLQDRVLARLLERSSLTRAQFETMLLDQLGSDMADKPLTRDEMTRLRRNKGKISRGAFYRTLQQARSNISESVHTLLLLGWCGMLESPSLAPFVEASERLRSQTDQLRQAAREDPSTYDILVESLLDDLEEAFEALRGRNRDT